MGAKVCAKCGAKWKKSWDVCAVCGSRRAKTAAVGARARRGSRGKSAWPALGLLAAGALLIGVSVFILGRGGEKAVTLQDIPDAHDQGGLPYPEVPRISPAEAWDRFQAGSAVFVDVRDGAQYAQAHIPGALSIPLAELENRYRELPQTAEIITYCT